MLLLIFFTSAFPRVSFSQHQQQQSHTNNCADSLHEEVEENRKLVGTKGNAPSITSVIFWNDNAVVNVPAFYHFIHRTVLVLKLSHNFDFSHCFSVFVLTQRSGFTQVTSHL